MYDDHEQKDGSTNMRSWLCVYVCAQEMMATTPGLVAHVVNLAALVLLPMVVIHVHSDGFSLGE